MKPRSYNGYMSFDECIAPLKTEHGFDFSVWVDPGNGFTYVKFARDGYTVKLDDVYIDNDVICGNLFAVLEYDVKSEELS